VLYCVPFPCCHFKENFLGDPYFLGGESDSYDFCPRFQFVAFNLLAKADGLDFSVYFALYHFLFSACRRPSFFFSLKRDLYSCPLSPLAASSRRRIDYIGCSIEACPFGSIFPFMQSPLSFWIRFLTPGVDGTFDVKFPCFGIVIFLFPAFSH